MPKRKAVGAKTELADLAAGDQPDPLVSKARRGRTKKDPEPENVVVEEKEKKGKTRKVQKEQVENTVEEEKPKKGAKKPVPSKANKEKEQDVPERKKSGRGKKVAEDKGEVSEDDEIVSKVTKRKDKEDDEANGITISNKEKEQDVPERKKSGRGKKVAEDKGEVSEDDEIVSKITKRKGKEDDEANGTAKEKTSRKKKTVTSADEPKAKGRKKADKEEKVDKPGPSNSTATKWDKIDFTCTKKNGDGQTANLKISCWNIGGLKSWTKKDCLKFLEYEDPDIFCVQETKCNEDKLPEEIKVLEGYKQYWCASEKEGYAGVGLLTKKKPLKVNYGINNEELDEDGRCITAEFDEYYIVCVYVPNAGRKLVTLPKRLEWNAAFKDYITSLDNKKPVIIAGDMNVAHNEIDLARPANNTKNAGFTQEEREGMTDFLEDGYVDTFRKLYPEKTDVYTFWTYMANARAKNIGWRLDYFIVSERIIDKVCDNIIRTEILGSDHCPFTLFINI